jgi:hypothetical protein
MAFFSGPGFRGENRFAQSHATSSGVREDQRGNQKNGQEQVGAIFGRHKLSSRLRHHFTGNVNDSKSGSQEGAVSAPAQITRI